jgi:hypothetical protein
VHELSVKVCRAFADRGLPGVCRAVAEVLPERRGEVESAAAQQRVVQLAERSEAQRGARLVVQQGARLAVASVARVVLSVPAEPGASVASEHWVPDARRGGGFPENAGLRSDREVLDTAEEGRACALRVFHRVSVSWEVRRGARPWVACFFQDVGRCEEWRARAVEAGRRARASADDLRPEVCAPVAWVSSAACWDCVDCRLAWSRPVRVA